MKWPASCQARIASTAPGVRLGGEDVVGACGSRSTQARELLGPQPVDLPRDLRLVRAGRRRSGAARPPRTGPSSGAASSRCRSRCARAAGTVARVPGFIGQARRCPRNALVRAGPDDGYADGDDSTWMTIDWPALTRGREIAGREVNVVDTGGDGPPLLFLHGLGGLLAELAAEHPARSWARTACIALGPARASARSEMPREDDLDPGLRAGRSTRSASALGDRRPGRWSATRWAASSAPSWRWRSRRGSTRLVLVSAAGISAEHMLARAAAGRRARLLAVARRAPARSAAAPVVTRGRGCAGLALQVVVRYPERLSRAAGLELVRGRGDAGLRRRAWTRCSATRSATGCREIEMPTLIVWGRNDILVPVERRRRVRAS